MNITNPVDIAFNLSKVYHLQRVTSHTVEGDGETTIVGKTISHYKVIEKLGGGGMGVLCKAEDTRLDLNVALKFLPEKYAQDAKPWNVPRQRHVLLWRYIIPTSGLSTILVRMKDNRLCARRLNFKCEYAIRRALE